ncbi:MAG: hypothetical protein ACRC1H_03340, partial [Caldilineaceae bacterium]
LDGSSATFTTRITASADTQGGHPRYIPIPNASERPGWRNSFLPGGCAGACHETTTGPFHTPPMPPACAAGGVEGCYSTP